ncbi:hypothetical protein GCM10010917_00490 [Paenibacillus physcomitrellae]|uniref:Uncharacterized protein n=1 Tax=Paenibacillus physcomitrellae TaxID=1619311 RepID=A0ABQ1FM31_9BACL|nr:hypothetical protein GCM10010917_00490 [Paenibacillus physcomitrellae]
MKPMTALTGSSCFELYSNPKEEEDQTHDGPVYDRDPAADCPLADRLHGLGFGRGR